MEIMDIGLAVIDERCFAGFIGDDCNNKDTNFIINDDNKIY